MHCSYSAPIWSMYSLQALGALHKTSMQRHQSTIGSRREKHGAARVLQDAGGAVPIVSEAIYSTMRIRLRWMRSPISSKASRNSSELSAS